MNRGPWLWVPTLYFSQGIPYVIVMTLSVVMYKRLGLSNTDIALYTSWLYLPWVIKPLWSPLVDMAGAKRFWVVSMQFLIAFGLALAAFSIRGPAFFKWSLFLFWIMAFASATHDIAADGFYMLSLSRHDQAWWVGLRGTFYRTAMIVGSGLLVVLAGVLETRNGPLPVDVRVEAAAPAMEGGERTNQVASAADLPRPDLAAPAPSTAPAPNTHEKPPLEIIIEPRSLTIPATARSAEEAEAILDQVRQWNSNHGFRENPARPADARTSDSAASGGPLAAFGAAWTKSVARPLGEFLGAHFPRDPRARRATAGNIGLIQVSLSRPPASNQTVVVTLDRRKTGLEVLGLGRGDKGFRLVEGERLRFDSRNWNQPARAAIQLDPRLKRATSAGFQAGSGDVPLAWSITLFAVAGLFLAFSCWHRFALPRPAADGPVRTSHGLAGEFFNTLGSFFRKPGWPMALAFILLYRFDEAQLVKVISPFLLDGPEAGGLGLSTSQVGLVYGTFGVLALTCGGLLGGFAAARYGLKRMLPWMVGSMYLPKLAFLCLSIFQPENFLVPCAAIAVEQFGYGFGFTAFLLYLLYFSDGPHRTAHYAVCTGFMALGMMIPGLWSGWLADLVGYRHFFVWVLCSALPGFILALRIKVDPEFGKKRGPPGAPGK